MIGAKIYSLTAKNIGTSCLLYPDSCRRTSLGNPRVIGKGCPAHATAADMQLIYCNHTAERIMTFLILILGAVFVHS